MSLYVFETILVETEAFLNSKTLKIVADLPEKGMPFTLNHFPVKRPLKSVPPGKFNNQDPPASGLGKCAANDQPFLETTRQGVTSDTVKEVQRER